MENTYRIVTKEEQCIVDHMPVKYNCGTVKIPAIIIKNVILDNTMNVTLTEPVAMLLEQDDMFKTTIITNSEYNILIYSKGGIDDCIREINEYFNALYKGYVKCNEYYLTGDAIILKDKLKKLFGM